MKRLVSFFSALLVTLILTGCGSAGKNFPVAHVAEIKNGVTTQSQILDWFGVAFKEGQRNGNPMWTYQFDMWHSIGKEHSKDWWSCSIRTISSGPTGTLPIWIERNLLPVEFCVMLK